MLNNNLAVLLKQVNLGPCLTYTVQSSQCEGFSGHCGENRPLSIFGRFEKKFCL